jgi:antitoxin component YwqK of YwqJK toxin-antitoxin module
MQKFILTIFTVLGFVACNTSAKSQAEQQSEKGPKNGLVQTYNEDGSISASIQYKNNVRHGLASDYYTDGKLRAEIEYAMGLKEGLATWYHKNGIAYRVTPYKNDQKHGVQKKFYEDGSLMSELSFAENYPGIGLKEFNKSGQERRVKTTIILGEKTALEDGSWRVEVRLNNKVKEVELFQGSLINNAFMHGGLKPINKTANSGFAIIPKGQKQVGIVAKYSTRYKNDRVLTGTAKL